MEALRKDQHYTFADYCTWPEDERWELIDGIPYAMATPSSEHLAVSGEIFRQLANFLVGKPCKVFHAPFAVRLNAEAGDDTVVEPNISVICDKSKIDDKGCNGAPDLVIEILSPSTARHDRVTKFNKYMEAGVREYWIVDLVDRAIHVNHFEKNTNSRVYEGNIKIPVGILPGCTIDLKAVFAE